MNLIQSIEQLQKNVIALKPLITSEGEEAYSKLIKSFNDMVNELDQHLYPSDAWMEDKEFMQFFMLWVSAVSNGNAMNEARQRAALIDLKNETDNNIETAKKALVNAAKYGTHKFIEAVKSVPAAKRQKTEMIIEKPVASSLDTFMKQYGVEYERQGNELIIKGILKPFEVAKIIKATGLNLKFIC